MSTRLKKLPRVNSSGGQQVKTKDYNYNFVFRTKAEKEEIEQLEAARLAEEVSENLSNSFKLHEASVQAFKGKRL